MRAILRLSTRLAVLLLVASAPAHAQGPRMVLFEDPELGAERLHYPLLISNARGYRIRCASQADEEAVIRGLGFASVPSQILTAVDPDLVAAAPASNPLLCPSGPAFPIQMFANDGPDGRVYYLQFPTAMGSTAFTDALYVPRCIGLVTELKLDLAQARIADPTPFFQGKIHEISCLTGNAPFGAPPEDFTDWCVKGDRTPAETATVTAVLDATPVGASALGNAAACADADQFLRSVQSLNLNGRGVQSLAPLAALQHLTSLSLVGNAITDLAPLSKLRALTFLDLARNQVSNVVALAPLTTLTRLDLSDNRIQDVRFLSALTLLTSLALDGNALVDLAPLQFLQVLANLSLARNGLTGEKLEPLTALGALSTLDLSQNNIETFTHLGEFASSVEIDLSGNPIATSDGRSFLDLCILHRDEPTPLGQSIRALAELHGGATCSTVSGALLASTTLDLSAKAISDLRPVGGLTHLAVLNLSGNAISDVAPLSGLVNLVDLDLSDNNITDIRPVGPLTRLTRFTAAGNPVALGDFLSACLMRNHEGVLTAPQAAEVGALLDVSGRSACQEARDALRQIQSASASGRGLTTLSYFPILERLESLDLSNNALTNLSALSPLQGLTRLRAQQNQIASMAAVTPLRQLEHLYLDQNPLGSLEGIAALAKLQRVHFSSTGVRSVHPLASLPQLESASMRNLSLIYSGLGDYCLVHKFDAVALGENGAFMAAVESALAAALVDTNDCTAVEQWARTVLILTLNKKSITSVKPIAFFTALQELYLYDNLIQDAQPIASLQNLRKLNLSTNRLTGVPRLDSSQMEQLYLAQNELSQITNLSNLHQLQYLSVKDNRLIDPSPVAGIATLSDPDLRNNQIGAIDKAMSVIPRQPYLKGNPVCQLMIHLPPLNDACRREPPRFLIERVERVELINPRLIRHGVVSPIHP